MSRSYTFIQHSKRKLICPVLKTVVTPVNPDQSPGQAPGSRSCN